MLMHRIGGKEILKLTVAVFVCVVAVSFLLGTVDMVGAEEEKIVKTTAGDMKFKKKRMWHWTEYPPEVMGGAFVGLDIRYLITDNTVPLNKKTVFGRAVFPKGSMHGKHVHNGAEEVVYVISGKGKAFSNGKVYDVKPGCVQFVPQGEVHGLKNPYDEDLVIVYAYFGANSVEASGYDEPFPQDEWGF
jgi:quercetin dioxygenase-like cupin family protein